MNGVRLDLTLSKPFDGPVEMSAAAFLEQHQAEAACHEDP